MSTALDSILTGSALDAAEFDPMQWCVDGIIPEGTGVLVAPPKAGKSWLVAGIGLACAAGGIALGSFPVTQRPVLYLALEDGPRRLQDRFRRLTGGEPIPDIHITTDVETALELTAAYLQRHRHDKPLVILDTFGKVMKPKFGGPSYLDDYQQVSNLMRMQQQAPGSTLLIVHHTRKQESVDFVHTASGTTGITGAADFVIALERDRNESDAVLKVTGRDVPEDQFALKFGDGLWTIDHDGQKRASGAAERQRFSENTNRVLEFVRSRPETKPADVADHLGIDAKRAAEILTRRSEEGLIRKLRHGVYGPLADSADSAEMADGSHVSNPHTEVTAEMEIRTGGTTADFDTTPNQGTPHTPHSPQATHSPGPGHDSISSPEGDVTIEDAGVGIAQMPCKAPHCGWPQKYRGFCEDCIEIKTDIFERAESREHALAKWNDYVNGVE